jgi:hypothetical protein
MVRGGDVRVFHRHSHAILGAILRRRGAPAVVLILIMMIAAGPGPGCVSRVHRVPPDVSRILAAHNLEVPAPPGWYVSASPLHFLNTVALTVTSPDHMVVAIEVSPGRIEDPTACIQAAKKACYDRFGGGQFHGVKSTVGTMPAEGFDGTVFSSKSGGQRFNLLYRCFSTADRNVVIQAQAPVAIWNTRQGDVDALLKGIRVGPAP